MELLADRLAEIGSFGTPHGLKGEINLYAPFPDDFFDSQEPVFLFASIDNTAIPFEVEGFRPRGVDGYLVKLAGINSAEDAEMLQGCTALVEREILAQPDYDDDNLYAEDLEGFAIEDESHRNLGTVCSYDDSTANVLLICCDTSNRTFYIPFVDEYISDVDPENKQITVNLPDGFTEI